MYVILITAAKQLLEKLTPSLLYWERQKKSQTENCHETPPVICISFCWQTFSLNQQLRQTVVIKKRPKKRNQKCQRKLYSVPKPPPHPALSLPMADQFQQTIAMDLREYHGYIILHLIDICTRLSAAAIIPNKNRHYHKGNISNMDCCMWLTRQNTNW